jgi:hypothetical protein
VATHGPELKSPRESQARHGVHTQVAPGWLQDQECRARHEQCQTKIALAIELGEEAIRSNAPVGVVVFAAWSLAEAVGQVLARRRQDGISLRQQNRLVATARLPLRDANGGVRKRPGPPIAVAALVPLLPVNASRAVTVGEHPDGGFTRRGRLPTLGRSGSW